MEKKRYRKRVEFWLDLSNEKELEIYNWILRMKSERKFHPSLLSSIRLRMEFSDYGAKNITKFISILNSEDRGENSSIPIEESDNLESFKGVSGEFVYVVKDSSCGLFKIGRSSSLYERLYSLKQASTFGISIVSLFKTDNSFLLEKTLHREYEAKRVKGEWFNLNSNDVATLLIKGESIFKPNKQTISFTKETKIQQYSKEFLF